MDLETFIAETLRQIVKGVKTAQSMKIAKAVKSIRISIGNEAYR